MIVLFAEMEMFHQASMKLGLDRAVLAHARNEGNEESERALEGSSGKASGKSQLSASEVRKRQNENINKINSNQFFT